MRKNLIHAALSLTSVTLALLVSGCAVPDLPETLDVALTATQKVTAPRDSGPPSLANTAWGAFPKAEPAKAGEKGATPTGPYGGLLDGRLLPRPPADEQMFVADFGDEGRSEGIRENQYLLPNIYGEEVPVSESWTNTSIPLLAFRSASYGVEEDDRYGFAIFVQVKAGPLFVGHAILYSWGTRTSEDRIDGTFGYLFDLSEGIGRIILDTSGDQYPFYGIREDDT